MKLDERVKFKDGRPYVEYFWKSGPRKGQIKRQYGEIIICKVCGEKCFAENMQIKRGWGKFCSLKCQLQLENNPHWKNGKVKMGYGYIGIRFPCHPNADNNGHIMEHRLIIEKQIGRYLKPKEQVHHINGIKNDNRPENLMAFKNNGIHRTFERGLPVNSEDIVFDGRKIISPSLILFKTAI